MDVSSDDVLRGSGNVNKGLSMSSQEDTAEDSVGEERECAN